MDEQWMADQLAAVLQKKDEQGRFVHSDREVQDVAAIFLLTVAAQAGPDALLPESRSVLNQFAERAQLEDGMHRAEVAKRVEAYLETNPIHPALANEIEQALSNISGEFVFRQKKAASKRFARFSPQAATTRQGALDALQKPLSPPKGRPKSR